MWDYVKGEYVVDNPEDVRELTDGMELLRDGDNIVIIDRCENVVAWGETVPDLLAAIDIRLAFEVMFALSPDADTVTLTLCEV